jgi:acetyl/propionyl-CoA carboxylase alpha subunit
MEERLLDPDARIGVLNRGEAALRFIRAVRDHNTLYGTRLVPVAFHTDAEEQAPFIQAAGLAFTLSTFPAAGRPGGNLYLNRDLMIEALKASGCSAAWAGWGFLSEDAAFVERLERNELVFLGPPARSMALLGDKIAAKELAERNGVPVLPWSGRPVGTVQEARKLAARIGYPCILKAASAGGGRGIRAVADEQELPERFRSAREEALRVSGESRLFIERLVARARHLEVQVLADLFGTVQTFGVRDCSVQRRNQKIIEETPPPGLPARLGSDMEACAALLIRAGGYYSAGTVEFLYDLERHEYSFMEVNTRLQVEHPITEQAYGVDLVMGQIRVALGERLASKPPSRRQAAVEARLNAEDPDLDFLPAPGRVVQLRLPAGPGIRVDSGVEQGSLIPPEFDSMIAKIIAYAPTRALALARLQRALAELRVKIEGGTTNRASSRSCCRTGPASSTGGTGSLP